MEKSENLNWIDKDVVIDFKLPRQVKEIISYLERYNAERNEAAYYNYTELLDYSSKDYVTLNVLNEKQWDILLRKYCNRFWY